MSESLDILPVGAAEEYEEYLNTYHDDMESLLEQINGLAERLDDHDENDFTKSIQAFLKGLSENAVKTADSVREITEELLRTLEEKNAIVNSSAQDEYISIIKTAAQNVNEFEPFKDCNLISGGVPFSDEEKVDLQQDLIDVTDDWETCINELCQKAKELSDRNEKDELSDIYLSISELLEKMLHGMFDNIEKVGNHLNVLEEHYSERKSQMNELANDTFEDLVDTLIEELEDLTGDFSEVNF